MEDIEGIKIELNEIKKMLNDILSSSNKEIFKPLKEYMFYDWLDVWLENYKKPIIKPSSLKVIETQIRNHIKGVIENKPLTEINAFDLQIALNQIETTRTKKYVYDIFNSCFSRAYKLKLIEDNLILSVDKVKHKNKLGSYLTDKQQKEFLKVIKNSKYEKLYIFYLLTGCRRAEALSIKWSDIDFRKKTLAIHGTKTETSERVIQINSALEMLLKSIPKDNEYIFPYSVNAVKINFQRRIKPKLSFDIKLHSLRHTFATRCVENDVSMKVIQKWLGHSNYNTTANIYTHVSEDFEKKQAKKLVFKLPK